MFFLFADVRTVYMVVYTRKAKDAFLEASKSAVKHFGKYEDIMLTHFAPTPRPCPRTEDWASTSRKTVTLMSSLHQRLIIRTFLNVMSKLLIDLPQRCCTGKTFCSPNIGTELSFTPLTAASECLTSSVRRQRLMKSFPETRSSLRRHFNLPSEIGEAKLEVRSALGCRSVHRTAPSFSLGCTRLFPVF